MEFSCQCPCYTEEFGGCARFYEHDGHQNQRKPTTVSSHTAGNMLGNSCKNTCFPGLCQKRGPFKIKASASSKDIFGGDCSRIARIRTVLDEVVLSDMNCNDQRVVSSVTGRGWTMTEGKTERLDFDWAGCPWQCVLSNQD